MQSITFFHAGKTVALGGQAPTRTVLQWLREDARCTGTKEGCNEGDCGACTVVVGERDAVTGQLVLKPVNACLQLLPTLHGKALYTVEDLAGDDGGLHPVQRAMVDCHASQCGFCTPGFVMSIWFAQLQRPAGGAPPSRRALADAVAGNLCRCTGYRPILDAAERACAAPAPALDTAPALAALAAIDAGGALAYAAAGGRCDAPVDLDHLADLRLARPQARLLAGGTDVGVWVNKQFRPLPDLIHIGRVAALQRIETVDGVLSISAGAPLESAWRALAAAYPALEEVWLRFASPPIRHAGTLGGNIANGSPIGDGAPVLMALGAELVLRRGDRRRTLPLDDFYLGYMRNALEPGEFLERLRVPLPHAGQQLRVHKVAKRHDSDISAVCGAFAVTLAEGRVAAVRLAYGGMAATVQRAAQAEAAMRGQPWSEATATAAAAALAADFTPLTDVRGSAAYRLQVAGNLLRRLWLQTRDEAPLPAAATSVWAGLRRA